MHAYLEDFFVYNILKVCEFTPPTPVSVTLSNDFEIQGHVILHVTWPISASTHARATNLFLILMFYGSGNSFHLLPCICITLTDDLEIQGNVILHVTLPISATTLAAATNLFLFLIFYVSGNSFQFLPNAWPSRMTLKSKFTWLATWSYLTQLYYACCSYTFDFGSNILCLEKFIPPTAKW